MKTQNRFGQYSYQPVNSGLESNARTNFVSKVYSILSIQLMFTAAVVMLNIFSPTFAKIQYTYNSLWWLSLIVSLGALLALTFSPSLSKNFPSNMILLGLFTAGESYLVSYICSYYTPESVLMAAVATCAATFGITFYAFTTKSDFTKMIHSVYAFASAVFWIFLFISLFNVFIFRSSFLSSLMAFVIACIYSIYILVDTQLVMGGKNKELTLDNYVMGSMILYVDIIGLFLKLLQLLGDKKKR